MCVTVELTTVVVCEVVFGIEVYSQLILNFVIVHTFFKDISQSCLSEILSLCR
jgi:hypothetical protein